MPRTAARRDRLRLPVPLAAFAVAVSLLGACTGRSTASSYSDSVEEEFLFGCTTGGRVAVDGRAVRSDTTDQAERKAIADAKATLADEVPGIDGICQCTYDRLEKSVPFDDLKKVTDDLEREPDALPANLREIGEACEAAEGRPG